MTGEPGPPAVRKFSIPLSVSAADLTDAQEMREHERRRTAMTPERAERRARQDAERAAALAAAVVDWQAVCDRLASNAPALAVLAIHKPANSYGWRSCAHCREGDECDLVGWPCETFTAVKDA